MLALQIKKMDGFQGRKAGSACLPSAFLGKLRASERRSFGKLDMMATQIERGSTKMPVLLIAEVKVKLLA